MVLTLKHKYCKQIKKSPYNQKAHLKDSLFSVDVKQASRSDLSKRLAVLRGLLSQVLFPPQCLHRIKSRCLDGSQGKTSAEHQSYKTLNVQQGMSNVQQGMANVQQGMSNVQVVAALRICGYSSARS